MQEKRNVSYSVRKMAQILGYLLSIGGKDRMERLKLIKILWAADRIHIRKYGRTVSETNYVAMRFGPVSSLALNVAKVEIGPYSPLDPDDAEFLSEFFDSTKVLTILLKDPGEDYLSDTDKWALNEAWKKFQNEDGFKIAEDISHQYPEWAKYKGFFAENKSGQQPIDLEDFFKNPPSDNYFVEKSDDLTDARLMYLQNERTKKSLEEAFGVQYEC